MTCSLVIAGVLGLGCSKHAATTVKPVAKAPAAEVAAAPVPAQEEEHGADGDGKSQESVAQVHGANKKLVHPVSVFLDGVQVGVLTQNELPPGLEARDNAREEQLEKRYYRMSEYLEKIGVPVARIKTIHMAGARDHVASLEGSELAAGKDRFVFSFGNTMSGMPMSSYATTGLKNQFRIDTIRNITIFMDKPAPALDMKHHCYLGTDGTCAPAYDQKEVTAKGKGTRVYIDGKLAGFVKRKLVDPEGTAGEDHSLGKYLATLGADLKSVQAVEFMGGENLFARATTENMKSVSDFTFGIPRHSHGRIVVSLPPSIMAQGATADRKIPITVVQVYRKAAPSTRSLVEVTDDAVASLSQLGSKQAESFGRDDGDEI